MDGNFRNAASRPATPPSTYQRRWTEAPGTSPHVLLAPLYAQLLAEASSAGAAAAVAPVRAVAQLSSGTAGPKASKNSQSSNTPRCSSLLQVKPMASHACVQLWPRAPSSQVAFGARGCRCHGCGERPGVVSMCTGVRWACIHGRGGHGSTCRFLVWAFPASCADASCEMTIPCCSPSFCSIEGTSGSTCKRRCKGLACSCALTRQRGTHSVQVPASHTLSRT